MTCEFCGSQTARKRVTKQHWLNGRLYVVENVEAEVCTECGQRFFHARTLDAIDAALSTAHSVKDRLEVEVVSL